MINLLPDDTKRDIRAARMNVSLLRYNIITIIAAALLVCFCLVFYVLLNSAQSSSASKSSDNTTKAKSFDTVRAQADDYRNNLTIAKQILDKSFNYTSIIFAITELLPSGVVLDNLTLNATDFGKQTSFSARTKTYNDATKLKESFEKSTIFTNVHLQNLSDTSGDKSASNEYPVLVTISAVFNKDKLETQ